MSRRHLINAPDAVIPEALEGLALTYPDLVTYEPEAALVLRRTFTPGKVGLVSGGGSGHEPLHAGFVGTGMLDVAVAGAVFASPTAWQIHAATRAAERGAGVLQIVKNYTGDVLNFQIAAEIAADDGVEVASVLVDDDLATSASAVGRRGTAAVVAVEKICGAAAEAGADLSDPGRARPPGGRGVPVARPRPGRLRPPRRPRPGVRAPGRPRRVRRRHPRRARHRPDPLRHRRRARRPAGRNRSSTTWPWTGPTRSSLIVNGLGGTYPIGLSIAARRVHHHLGARGITVARSLVGSYVTSLDMNGLSVTLLRADDELLRLWDAPVRTPTLTW